MHHQPVKISCFNHLYKPLCVCEHDSFEICVFPLTGMDNCCHVSEQEIQEATSYVYCEPFVGTGEHMSIMIILTNILTDREKFN